MLRDLRFYCTVTHVHLSSVTDFTELLQSVTANKAFLMAWLMAVWSTDYETVVHEFVFKVGVTWRLRHNLPVPLKRLVGTSVFSWEPCYWILFINVVEVYMTCAWPDFHIRWWMGPKGCQASDLRLTLCFNICNCDTTRFFFWRNPNSEFVSLQYQ